MLRNHCGKKDPVHYNIGAMQNPEVFLLPGFAGESFTNCFQLV